MPIDFFAPRPCPDCGVAPGEHHKLGCDVCRCPACGRQELSCDCAFDTAVVGDLAASQLAAFNEKWAAKRKPWTGVWPGWEECREYWFWCLMAGTCAIHVGPDCPGAVPDLNRLYAECVWDAEQQKFVPKPKEPPCPS